MEDIGDLLFYLLAGLFAVAGLLGKKKKKPVINIPGEDTSMEQGEIIVDPAERARRYEEILNDEIFGVPEMPPPEVDEPAVPVEFLESAKMEGTYEEEMASLFLGEGISSLDYDNMEAIGKDEDEDEEIGGDNFIEMEDDVSTVKRIADSFNLPEAIIFSEILNRKERF